MLPSNLFCIRTVVKSPMHGPSPTSSQIVDASFAARSRTLVWVLCVLGLAASMAEDIKSYRKLTARADACDPHCTEVRPLHPRAFKGRVPFILTVEVAFGVVASTTKASDTRTTPPSIRRRNATTRRCLRLCSAPSVAPRTALNSPHLAPRPAPHRHRGPLLRSALHPESLQPKTGSLQTVSTRRLEGGRLTLRRPGLLQRSVAAPVPVTDLQARRRSRSGRSADRSSPTRSR